MSRFQGLNLFSWTKDKSLEAEVRKMGLDILQKLNTVYSELLPVNGSSSNGRYIKFPDGTMIQRGGYISIGTGTNQVVNITYPQTFLDNYATGQIFTYSIVSNIGNNPSSYVTNGFPTTTGCQVTYTVAAGSVNRIGWIAIGKWK